MQLRSRVRTRSVEPSLWFCLINGLLVGYRSPLPVPPAPTCSRPLAATSGGGGPAAISPHGLCNFGKLRSNSRLRPLSTQRRRRRCRGDWLVPEGTKKNSWILRKDDRCWLAMTVDLPRSIWRAKKKRDRGQLYRESHARLRRILRICFDDFYVTDTEYRFNLAWRYFRNPYVLRIVM